MQTEEFEIDAIVAARGRTVRAERVLWLARKPPMTWAEFLKCFDSHLETEFGS
jgi:hypothetical protein